jgi:hypothetical protein
MYTTAGAAVLLLCFSAYAAEARQLSPEELAETVHSSWLLSYE